MKVKLNLDNFNENDSPQYADNNFEEIFNTLIPIGKSGIHIKKENRGTFTKYCGGNVTDACIKKGKNSPNPAIRKKAVFAENARHWAKKHLNGGNLADLFSNFFLELDTPPSYEYNKINSDNTAIPLFNYLDYTLPIITSNPEVKNPKETKETKDTELPTWYMTPRITPEDKTEEPKIVDQVGSLPIPSELVQNVEINNNLLNVLKPHLGKPYRVGNYDCSNFVSRVIKDMGYNLYGNCRILYNGTSRIDINNIQPGDLIFLQNTQPGKVQKGLASHVAIVTNTDNLKNGVVQIAHNGNSGGVSNITEWNLNDPFIKEHLLGAGRLKASSKKMQHGGLLGNYYTQMIYNPNLFSDLFLKQSSSNYNSNPNTEFDFNYLDVVPPTFVTSNEYDNVEHSDDIVDYNNSIPDWFANPNLSSNKSQYENSTINTNSKGYRKFKEHFDKYLKKDPSAKKYENVLTSIAKHESNFNPSIQNTAGAPAYGYFQFWQDNRLKNITKYSGLTVKEFLNNPQVLIASAVKMAKDIENSFTKEDLELAAKKGYSVDALIRGAWLGGVGGVRQVLKGTGNPSDSKWYGGRRGRSVKQAMDGQV